jgi:chorismate mutase|tara:strand:- start:107 stop:424 length:318 start_codon:yes stop_codon:yes gene_type:complete
MEANKAHNDKDVDIESLRAEIDECDEYIVELLVRRFNLARKIGTYKAIHNLPIMDAPREKRLLSNRRRQASEAGNYSIDEVFKRILEESRQIQMRVREELGIGGT